MEWSAFYPDILPNVEGCPLPLVDHHLRRAAIEICKRAKRIKVDVSFDTVAGTPEYTIDPGAGFKLVSILDINCAGKPIDPISRAELSRFENWQTETGTPTRFITTTEPTVLRLWKTPDTVFTIKAGISIRVDEEATEIADWFGDQYREGLCSGAIARLCAMPKKGWTDYEQATLHQGRFERELSKAAAEGIKDGTRAPLRTTKHGRA